MIVHNLSLESGCLCTILWQASPDQTTTKTMTMKTSVIESPPLPALSPTNLKIFTNVQLRQDFYNDPKGYAARAGIVVIVEECFTTEGGTVVTHMSLFRRQAIRISCFCKGGHATISFIEVNTGLLIYGSREHPLAGNDGLKAMSCLLDTVAPLLKDPLRDACAIVPGMEAGGVRRARWDAVEATVSVNDVQLANLYNLRYSGYCPMHHEYKHFCKQSGHIQTCIRIDAGAPDAVEEPGSMLEPGPKIRVVVKMDSLGWGFDSSEGGCPFAPRSLDFAPRFHAIISELGGFHLPPPPGTAVESDIAKMGRLIALASHVNPENREVLKVIGQQVFTSPKKRWTELKRAVRLEAARLKPVPVQALFTPQAVAAHVATRTRDSDYPIHPMIAAAYDLPTGSSEG